MTSIAARTLQVNARGVLNNNREVLTAFRRPFALHRCHHYQFISTLQGGLENICSQPQFPLTSIHTSLSNTAQYQQHGQSN